MMTVLDPTTVAGVITILVTGIGGMFAALVTMIKRNDQNSARREEKMAGAISEMEKFQREVLVNIVRSSQEAMVRHSQALDNNTRVTEELRKEIAALAKESEMWHRRQTGDLGS